MRMNNGLGSVVRAYRLDAYCECGELVVGGPRQHKLPTEIVVIIHAIMKIHMNRYNIVYNYDIGRGLDEL